MIDFHVTGGKAGVNQELMVNSNGDASVTTNYRQNASTQRFRLSPADVAALADKLGAARVATLPKPSDSGCADCLEYSIGPPGPVYRTDQVSIPGRLEPLVSALNKLVGEHSSGSAPTISGK